MSTFTTRREGGQSSDGCCLFLSQSQLEVLCDCETGMIESRAMKATPRRARWVSSGRMRSDETDHVAGSLAEKPSCFDPDISTLSADFSSWHKHDTVACSGNHLPPRALARSSAHTLRLRLAPASAPDPPPPPRRKLSCSRARPPTNTSHSATSQRHSQPSSTVAHTHLDICSGCARLSCRC